MLHNQPPSCLGERQFEEIQARLSNLGSVNVVTTCIKSENPQIVMATLKLAVALLDGGNPQVQRQFAEILQHPVNQGFFTKFRSLFQDSTEAILGHKVPA